MKRLRLAMVGCGDIAHYTAWISRLVPQVELAACCDRDPARAQAFARRHGIRQVYAEYAQLLAETPAEAVYLAVPHDLHEPMLRAAVATGRATLVEKPLTRTLAEGQALIRDLAPDARVGVNYQYRYDAAGYALGRAVQDRAFGAIRSVRINVPWRRTQAYFDQAPWHRTLARAGGGTLITQGSHFLDLALWALREPPVSAVGYTGTPGFAVEVDTLTHGIVQTQGGTLINITSTLAAAAEQAVTLEVYGEHATACYTSAPWPRLTVTGRRFRREPPPVRGLHALQRSLAGFADWVLHDRPYLIPAASTVPVLAAVDGIYRAAHTGTRVTISV